MPCLAGTFLGSLTPAMLSVAGFSAARFALGLAEGGNFPGAIKTVGLWHPKSERAVVDRHFQRRQQRGHHHRRLSRCRSSSTRCNGAGPAAFYLTGALGFVWLVFWLAMYDRPERHPRVSPAELAHIRSDPPDPPATSPGSACCDTARPGPTRSAMFLIISRVVVLFVLDAEVPRKQPRHRPGQVFWPLLGGLPDGRRGQHRRRRAFLVADPRGATRQRGAQDGLLRLRLVRCPSVLRSAR